MATKRPRWQRKLTKAEIKHIRETTDTGSLAQFKRNLEWQRERDTENPDGPVTCLECRHIANVIGI